MKVVVAIFYALIVLLPGVCQGANHVTYTFMDVGNLGGTYTYARGINELGQVVGYSYSLGNAGGHGFRTAPNQPINPSTDDIGVLGTRLESNAMAINESGQIAGWGQVPPYSSYLYHAICTGPTLPLKSATDDLGGLGGNQAVAAGINDSGVLVGYAQNSSGVYHAFRVATGKKINPTSDDIGKQLTGASYANAINNSGRVVGYYMNSTNHKRAYSAAPGQAINTATDDLGTLGGLGSYAYDINDLGQVVGGADVGSYSHAFRTGPNAHINPLTDDLGTLPGYLYSEARAVNDLGQVVGSSYNMGSDVYRAFYDDGTYMYDLNSLAQLPVGCVLTEAFDINDRGQIVGRAVINGSTHGFVLTPTPEPSTLVLLGVGALGLLSYGWRRRIRISAGVVLLSAASTALGNTLPQYAVTDLGTLGGTWSEAFAVNGVGQVVGQASTGSAIQAFLYSSGTMQNLGTFPGGGSSMAYGINDSGQVVGQAFVNNGALSGYHAFLYSSGTMQDLGTLSGISQSSANAIGNGGEIVGSSYNNGKSYARAFLESNGTMQNLGTLRNGRSSEAYAVNNGGQVAGIAYSSSGYAHAFLYSHGTMQDLGTANGYAWSVAYGINNNAQVVGATGTSYASSDRAFLDSNGTMQILGTLPGGSVCDALGINDSGQVVGYAWVNSSGTSSHAFLYSGGRMQDLNSLIPASSGWTLTEATGINNNGQICGYGQYGGQQEAFLLTPVPEPSTVALLCAVAIGLLGYGWRSRIKIFAGVVLLFVAGTASANSFPQYTVTDLGTIQGGSGSEAWALTPADKSWGELTRRREANIRSFIAAAR